jgi:hypothetical protein
MSKSHDVTPFENFSDKDLILAIEQGNLAAQEYAVKKYEHELFQILNFTAVREEKNTETPYPTIISGALDVVAEAKSPYKSKLLTILVLATSTMIDTTEQNPSSTPLSAYFDMSQFTSHEVADIMHLLSDAYRSIGGDGLAIKKIDFSYSLPISQS